MKILLIFFFLNLNLNAQPIDKKFHEKRRKIKVLNDYLVSIQTRYLNILLKISRNESEFRSLLSQYNSILATQQKYASDCSEKVNYECQNIYFDLMGLLNDLYLSFTKLEKKNPKLEFETLKALMKIQLLFVEYEIKRSSMSIHERYKLGEVLKNYVRTFFNEINKACPEKIRNPNQEFWKNFITQSHFLLSKPSNMQFFIKNFSLMNKSMYGLIYSLKNIEGMNQGLNNDVQAMNSQWNFIQKNLYKYEKR